MFDNINVHVKSYVIIVLIREVKCEGSPRLRTVENTSKVPSLLYGVCFCMVCYFVVWK